MPVDKVKGSMNDLTASDDCDNLMEEYQEYLRSSHSGSNALSLCGWTSLRVELDALRIKKGILEQRELQILKLLGLK